MLPLPGQFVTRVLRDLGETEGRALCEALDTDPPVSVRINPAKAPFRTAWNAPFATEDLPQAEGAAASDAAMRKTKDSVAGSSPSEVGFTEPSRIVGALPDQAETLPIRATESDSETDVSEPADGAAAEAAAGKRAAEAVSADLVQEVICRSEGSSAEAVSESSGDASAAGAGPVFFGAAPDDSSVRVEPVPWCGWGYYLSERPLFTFDPAFHAGAYYVQEAGSQFIDRILSPYDLAGRRVLDLCAAPGGKTTLYASLAGLQGLVVANEVDRRRAQVLADNVRKWGTGNVVVTVNEPRDVAAFENWFDLVAVDAPCSGEGMFRKDEGARAAWSEGNVRLCAVRQAAILREAWKTLRPGGILLYSTCTFNRTEDEEVLTAFAAECGAEVVEARSIDTEPAWGVECGRTAAFRTFRFYPHKARGEGFFAAIACKASDAEGRIRTPRSRRNLFAAVAHDEARELSRWLRQPEQLCFIRLEDTFYAYPRSQAEAVRSLSEGLTAIASGVEMGQIFKGKLKPAPALAFYAGLNRDALPTAELDRADALRYLRRQEVAAERFAEGINLVCAAGLALGFVKRIGGRVNNLYPQSLRILKNE